MSPCQLRTSTTILQGSRPALNCSSFGLNHDPLTMHLWALLTRRWTLLQVLQPQSGLLFQQTRLPWTLSSLFSHLKGHNCLVPYPTGLLWTATPVWREPKPTFSLCPSSFILHSVSAWTEKDLAKVLSRCVKQLSPGQGGKAARRNNGWQEVIWWPT